jgi:hypothetical protein
MRDWRLDLGDGYWYYNKPDHSLFPEEVIDQVEQNYNCRYVTEWYLDNKQMVLLFWNDVAHPQGSNWMGVYGSGDHLYVCDGIAASRYPVYCKVSNDKQVLFSKTRHDFRSSQDGSVTVDGGREYTRVLGAIFNESLYLVPQNGELKIIPAAMAVLMTERNK